MPALAALQAAKETAKTCVGSAMFFNRCSPRSTRADRPEDLRRYMPRPEDLPPGVDPPRPISVTFIPGTVFNNPALLRVNPDYVASLLSLPLVERARLLEGNWKIAPAAGLYFKRGPMVCHRGPLEVIEIN